MAYILGAQLWKYFLTGRLKPRFLTYFFVKTWAGVAKVIGDEAWGHLMGKNPLMLVRVQFSKNREQMLTGRAGWDWVAGAKGQAKSGDLNGAG
ncbi:MAG: hypothetical protein LBT47_09385 [Deltaproteobacteria bacterium]|nr:hypothetical protein [Deltaproteobacteria bacterium]